MSVATPPRHRRASRRTVHQVRSRAWVVSSLWWLAAAAGYLLFALAQPGCTTDGCLSPRAFLLGLGLISGLPALAVGMALSAIVVATRAKPSRSGGVLGTWAAWCVLGAMLTLPVLTLR